MTITDTNDFAPEFSDVVYTADLQENSLQLSLKVTATDRDGSIEYSQVSYFIVPELFQENFAIDESGNISVLKTYDFESGLTDIQFVVIAEDHGGLSTAANVRISITDENEHSPTFEQSVYSTSIPEDTEVPSPILRVSARAFTATPYKSVLRY